MTSGILGVKEPPSQAPELTSGAPSAPAAQPPTDKRSSPALVPKWFSLHVWEGGRCLNK